MKAAKKGGSTEQVAVLFDFDNTIASTASIRDIRESGSYDQLTAERLAKVAVYKPVTGLLRKLRSKSVKIGIITNSGGPYVKRLLDHLGLTDEFDVVVTYADVGPEGKKPSPKGIQLALKKLGVSSSEKVLFVGDDDTDLIAAYHAGVTPVLPSWASRSPVSTAPAIELSSQFLLDYADRPTEYRLFAEKSAELGSADFERRGVYFLPLDTESNVVTVRQDMSTFCLGRYFSQRAATTALLHDRHPLSKHIAEKESGRPFAIPDYWVGAFAHAVQHGAEFMFPDGEGFDLVTVIPAKQGKDPRLERLLERLDARLEERGLEIECLPDVLSYSADARSQKSLHANERRLEANRSLHLNPRRVKAIVGKRILVIDDVVTTGSTMSRARELLLGAGAASVVGLALAKTVSIVEDERQCPKCARTLRVQRNKTTNERFWGCSGYFEPGTPCNYSEPLITKPCPKCNRIMVVRINSRTGDKFWACTGYQQSPKCSHSEDFDPSEM